MVGRGCRTEAMPSTELSIMSLNVRGYANHVLTDLDHAGPGGPRKVLVQRLGAHTNIAHAVQQEEAVGRVVTMLFFQETWLQVNEDPLQLAGYTWFGHSRTVKKERRALLGRTGRVGA
jgi:hypothetical protein